MPQRQDLRSFQPFQNVPSIQNTWPPPIQMAPGPAPQEVYILDCKSCGTFLTNRGMSAVLLLQPDVSLFSSDALPANCSVSPGPQFSPPQLEDYSAATSSPACPSGLPAPVPRTCECLTQTLCCHGCGTGVGYMVVFPCRRCCSSITPGDSHVSRHRFVFFNKEIKASIRRYVPNEPGVIPHSPRLPTVIVPPHYSSSSPSPSSSRAPSLSNQFHRAYVPPSSAESSILLLSSQDRVQGTSVTGRRSGPEDPASYYMGPSPPVAFVSLKPQRGILKQGDILYWHNLCKSGEIPAVTDNVRARYHPSACSTSDLAGR